MIVLFTLITINLHQLHLQTADVVVIVWQLDL
jgi:hypothetical protein